MASTEAPAVTVDDLRDLFTGIPADNGEWSAAPCYRIELAYEIARRARPVTETDLRQIVYDSTAVDDIPPAALQAIVLGWQRFRLWQQLQPKRGL